MDENGNQTMTFLLNNTPRTVTKNNDRTLTVDGQIYTYLGNITLEQLIERNNQTQQVFSPGFGSIFPKEIIGILTKIDLAQDSQ
ncbi:hypothetical protein DRJ70_13730, partial [Enterococcus faecalis]